MTLASLLAKLIIDLVKTFSQYCSYATKLLFSPGKLNKAKGFPTRSLSKIPGKTSGLMEIRSFICMNHALCVRLIVPHECRAQIFRFCFQVFCQAVPPQQINCLTPIGNKRKVNSGIDSAASLTF